MMLCYVNKMMLSYHLAYIVLLVNVDIYACLTWGTLIRSGYKSCIIKWRPPHSILDKINFDGLVINNNNAVMGFVIRDAYDTPLLVGAKNVDVHQ